MLAFPSLRLAADPQEVKLVLDQLRAEYDLTASLDGDYILAEASGHMPSEAWEWLRYHKPEILALLREGL